MILRSISLVLILLLGIGKTNLFGQSAKSKAKTENYSAYLFTYFTGNTKADEAIRFAYSTDGYNFKALNGNKPVISSEKISLTGGVRDPHILRGHDGKTFYMVVTDMVSANGWDSNRGMVLLKSTDLVNWTSSAINFQKRFPGNENLKRVWAPQTIYDAGARKYMVYFSLKHGDDPDKIYYAYANKDFTDLETEPKQLFFSPNNSGCIDGDIILKDGLYHLFFKGETGTPGIKLAVSKKLTEGYTLVNEKVQQTNERVEGSGVFKLNNGEGYILMYDMYSAGKYQFTHSTDFKNFRVVDHEVTMDFHPRHGTVLPITRTELEKIVAKWMPASQVFGSVKAQGVRAINVSADSSTNSIVLPVKPGTDLKTLNPQFATFPGIEVAKQSPGNFADGPVKYSIKRLGDKLQSFNLIAKELHNPVIEGYYADPDILYSENTKKYYIYPTSDGFLNWGGTYFKTFSSTDLINWKDEGVILDLEKDVSWADKKAWAPCILEKKIDGKFKYFFYFTAEGKLGVASSDSPAGPFKDSGKPLVDKYPEGVKRGQQIDPEVFVDPQSGKTYFYWGNGYLAAAELNEDMMSFKEGTLKIMTPKNYTEGTTVFYRNGKYYFMWSKGDTRNVNYHLRWAMADSPLGELTVPENNILLETNKEKEIYATGHNSVIQIPGKDEWYIVYHRFNYPKGITMGPEAGYHREVCIDKLEFNADGTIKAVIPTHEGINAIK